MRSILALALVVTPLVFIGSVFVVGTKLTEPQLREIGAPPATFAAQSVQIARDDRAPISGWYAPGRTSLGSVLLLHGVGSNRTQMLGRARFLNSRGYAVLLIDLQAHGETPGTHITFGYKESRDVFDAVAYLRKRNPDLPVGILGVSLGGAAALLASELPGVEAMIVESVYNNIEKATENRLAIRLGILGHYVARLLLWHMESRIGIQLCKLSPARAISKHPIPVLVIAGENDRHTTIADSRELYSNALDPKEFWLVLGATHENYHSFAKVEYEKRVLDFFSTYLQRNPT